jgi:hypothetical protein
MDQLKVACILNLPPLMSDWSGDLPPYPGEAALRGFRRFHCRFAADGFCQPINVRAILAGNPNADRPLLTAAEPAAAAGVVEVQGWSSLADPLDEDPVFLAALATMEIPMSRTVPSTAPPSAVAFQPRECTFHAPVQIHYHYYGTPPPAPKHPSV